MCLLHPTEVPLRGGELARLWGVARTDPGAGDRLRRLHEDAGAEDPAPARRRQRVRSLSPPYGGGASGRAGVSAGAGSSADSGGPGGAVGAPVHSCVAGVPAGSHRGAAGVLRASPRPPIRPPTAPPATPHTRASSVPDRISGPTRVLVNWLTAPKVPPAFRRMLASNSVPSA